METERVEQEAGQQEPVATSEPKKSYDLPKKDFFNSGKMMKFAEQAGIAFDGNTDEVPVEKKAPAPKEEVPCPGCDKEKAAVQPAPRKDAPVKTAAPPDQAQARRAAVESEDSVALRKIAAVLTGEATLRTPTPKPVEKKTDEEDVDLDLVDPVIKKKLLDQEAKISYLEKVAQRQEATEQKVAMGEYEKAVGKVLEGIKQETPFDAVVDEDGGEKINITDLMFAGSVAALALRDEKSGHKLRTEEEYLKLSAKYMNKFQAKLRGASDVSKFTVDDVREKAPGVYDEIRQEVIADYLKEQQGIPPTVRSQAAEARPRESKKTNGKGLGISEQLKRWKNDASIALSEKI